MSDQKSSAFGAQLRRYREAAGLTQEQLAERAGLTATSVSMFERGRRQLPNQQTIDSLARGLGISAAEIAAWRDIFQSTAPTPDIKRQPLPVPAPLIGRETERAAAISHLRNFGRRLVTLMGPGGIGKTSLALRVAADLAGDAPFADGACVVPLASVTSAADLPVALAEALGIPLQGSLPIAEQLISALRDRSLLLVLDNLEHLLGGQAGSLAALIGRLLAEARGVALLATSRERLRLQDEWVLELGGLSLPALDAGPGVGQAAAVRLFVERARRVAPDFTLRADNQAAVAQICRRLQGQPLAIELAAAWARALSPSEILAELDLALDFLARSERDSAPRHSSLRAALDHSWNLLSEDERRALARLSVFRGGCDLAAADAVVGDRPPAAGLKAQSLKLKTLLAQLIDKSLLGREDTRGATRYILHELVRQYAAERLAADPDDQAATEARHLAYYAEQIGRVNDPQSAGIAASAGAGLYCDLDNLRLAWARATASGNTAALGAMARGLWLLHDHRGWLSDGAALFGAAAETLRTTAGADGLRGLLLGIQGYFLVRGGQIAASRRLLENGLALLQSAGASEGLHQLTYNLGIVEMRQGNIAEAHARFTQTAALARAAGDQLLLLLTELYFSALAKLSGDLPASEAHLNTCLSESRRLGYRRVESLCLVQFAELALYRDQYELAAGQLHEALQIASASRDMWVVSMCLGFLTIVAVGRGELEQARYLLDEAMPAMRVVGDAWSVGRQVSGVAQYEVIRGDLAAARRACAELVRIAAAGEALIIPETAANLAEICAREGHDTEALALLIAMAGMPGDFAAHRRAGTLRADLERRLGGEQQARAKELSQRPLLVWLREIAERPGSLQPAARQHKPTEPAGGLFLADTGETLGPREVEVLRLLMAGASNQAIADRLVISRFTAKNHVASILQKLAVATRTQAAMRGHALGLDPLPFGADRP